MDKLLCVDQAPGQLNMYFDQTIGRHVPEGMVLDLDMEQWAGFSTAVAPEVPVELDDLTLIVQDNNKSDGGYLASKTRMRVPFDGDLTDLNFVTRHEGVHYLEDKQDVDQHMGMTKFSNRGQRLAPYTTTLMFAGLLGNILTQPHPPVAIPLGTAALVAYNALVMGTYFYNPDERRADAGAAKHKQFSPFVLKPLSEYSAN